ncbi:uroporphyrinogen-III C-methyltransferase [Rhodanobacter sp. AS-Z3]|uniref:uroporphyrinogen-III C-methyltransferase n=1 Tax=Rhodanobacter sp. AS-Z3 TaxID=3031330 RepID=UPI00247AB760|nr:uroporphyrinogen-III C-methyltransferase [Rhodanobacter sp. AS-Z3]WEN15189.1 uroporphyrinogen-III C-methyltransferase [Rhodanobacter sp. AS-Z3]
MSNQDQPSKPEGVRPDPAPRDAVLVEPPVRPTRSAPVHPAPRSHGGGTLGLAVLLALIAVGASGYIGWRQWQQQQGTAADSRNMADLQQRVATLETTLTALDQQRSSLNQRLDDAAQVNRSLRDELLGQAERTRHVEDAVAKLAEKSLSGRDGMLLDETESLLRMAGERYTLFHDAQGAAAAYALADQALAAVNDGAFGGLRQSIEAEREALAKSQPLSQNDALQQLLALRGELAALPLKPLDHPATQATDSWSRVRRALSSVVSVQRDNGAPLAVADARFARELAALDLAQAQAALLAYDSKDYAAALQRVDAALASQFDLATPEVQQVRAKLQQLASQLPTKPTVQLGAALNELRNLRAVHALGSPTPSHDAAAAGEARP